MVLSSKEKKLLRGKDGFTLIELIVVIAVIAILASVMLPRFTGFTDSARESAMTSDIRNYATGVAALIAEGDAVTRANVEAMVGNLGGTFDATDVKSTGDTAADTLDSASPTDNPSGGDFKYTKTISGKLCVGTYDYEQNRIKVDVG